MHSQTRSSRGPSSCQGTPAGERGWRGRTGCAPDRSVHAAAGSVPHTRPPSWVCAREEGVGSHGDVRTVEDEGRLLGKGAGPPNLDLPQSPVQELPNAEHGRCILSERSAATTAARSDLPPAALDADRSQTKEASPCSLAERERERCTTLGRTDGMENCQRC
eukprot:2993893-Pleurochrysis_carterae.AAC.15